MAISPSTVALKQALKTDTAVKTFKAVNTVINLSVIGTDIIISKYYILFQEKCLLCFVKILTFYVELVYNRGIRER